MAKDKTTTTGLVVALALVSLGGHSVEVPANTLIEGDADLIGALKASGAVDDSKGAVDYWKSQNEGVDPITIEPKAVEKIVAERETILENTSGDTASDPVVE
jgi:hypothetical protein